MLCFDKLFPVTTYFNAFIVLFEYFNYYVNEMFARCKPLKNYREFPSWFFRLIYNTQVNFQPELNTKRIVIIHLSYTFKFKSFHWFNWFNWFCHYLCSINIGGFSCRNMYVKWFNLCSSPDIFLNVLTWASKNHVCIVALQLFHWKPKRCIG